MKYYNFIIGEKTNVPYSTGCYQEDNIWIIYEVGERQDFGILAQGTEEMFTKLDRFLQAKIELKERRERAK